MNIFNKSNPGFTIAELMIVIFLFAIFTMGIITLYIFQSRITGNEYKMTQTHIELGSGLNRLLPFIFDSDSILASTVINSTTYTSSATELVLRAPSIDASKNTITDTYDTFVVTRQGDNLVLITSPGAGSIRGADTKPFIDDLDSLGITYEVSTSTTASDWVKITVNRSVELSNSTKNISLTNQIYLRN